MVKLADNVKWFEPYFGDVSHLVPLEHLEKVFGMFPRLDQLQHHHAHLVDETDGRNHRKYISMYLLYTSTVKLKPLKRKIKAFSKVDLLEHLAHELAHLVHWKHTPNHKRLECEIMLKFMSRLQSTGYVSEEHELKNANPLKLHGIK